MLLTINWCPELGVYTAHNGQRERVIVPADIVPDGPLADVAEVHETHTYSRPSRSKSKDIGGDDATSTRGWPPMLRPHAV